MTAAYATAEGTRRYAARFADAAPGHFREPVGCGTPDEAAPLLSSLGIGTYLGAPDAAADAAYTAAVIAAVEGGINVLDSAINYRLQRSERSIAAALRELAGRGFAREEIVVCTKGGFLTPDGDMPDDAHGYLEREYLRTGILAPQDVAAGCHAMSPAFLANQLDRSRANLGVDCVDIYYLHNPETQLGEISREEFLRRLRAAFDFLESAAAAGKIRFYGLATWNGFRQPASAKDFLSLAEIEQVARAAAGGPHRFRFVQLPFNLAMTEALTRPNQQLHSPAVTTSAPAMPGVTKPAVTTPAVTSPAVTHAAVTTAAATMAGITMIEAAEALGISLVASASLLQGKMTKDLPPFIRDALGLTTDSERALQFVRSSPGIKTALVGMSHVEHVRANLRLVGKPPATAEEFSRLFARGQKS
jgi:aryl-alcohol dehydrogenase-like predicted oxidoreductase